MRVGARDLVAVGTLGAALALGGHLFLRSHELFGARWSDGETEFSPRDDGRVRHAVWEPSEELSELGSGSGATLSSDGRWLVFAQGERGLNVELYRAERHGNGFGAAEPIEELNSPADELAPCFGDGVLYFASDRPGGLGGLDLVRAPFAEGEFGAVERLAHGLNSPADESDPACVPASRALVFASNRARRARADFDLYRAEPDGAGFFALEALDALNTPSDERDPALALDARSLWFASDRGGNFDLFRAWGDGVRWERAEELATLNGPHAARGPWLASGGFELLFETHAAGAEPEFRRARSRELLTLPPPPVTLAEWITLVLLALIGMLALLARRWHELDILWKCLLVSLVVHLLLLYGMRHVYPEHERHDVGPRDGRSIRVRLAPEQGDARPVLEARLGPAAPEALARSNFTPAQAASEAPERLALAAPTANEANAPARERAVPEPAAVASPAELRDREARAQRTDGAAPSLALVALATGAEHASESTALERHAATPATAPERAPTSAALAAVAVSERGHAPRRAALDAEPAGSSSPATAALRAPAAEPLARVDAPPPGFDALAGLAASGTPAPAPTAAATLPEREAFAAAEHSESPAAPSALEMAPVEASRAGSATVPQRARLAAEPSAGGARTSAAELRAPAAEGMAAPATTRAPAFDALAGLAEQHIARPSNEERRPDRAALAALADTLPAPPAPAPTRALELPQPTALAAPERAPVHSDDTPYQNRFGDAKLRALEEFGGNEETEHAVAAGLAYLARIQNQDGSWGQRRDRHEKYLDVRVGKSALALLAFLGAGQVPGGGTEHAALVERTLGYLLATQDRASGHFGQSCAYGHGITTYALAECFALTQDERLRAPLERAVAHIVTSQHHERDPRFFGGWGYYFGDGHVWSNDEWPRTSVTAWQIMALESARLGGLAVDDGVFEAARTFLANTWDRQEQAFRYSHDPARLNSGWPILPASTPASLFGLSLLGVDLASDELAAARRFVLTRAPDGYRFTGDDDFVRRARGNPYFWYYGSLAMFRVGGREWEAWNRALQTTLLPSQDEDGSWRPLDPYAEYAGDEDEERTYTTAMCVLSLEVYYRYFTPLLRVR